MEEEEPEEEKSMETESVKEVGSGEKEAVGEGVGRRRGTSVYPYKRAAHPFLCRLNETAAFTVTAPNALIAAGFASMGMGLFTLFRPTPVLLFLLVSHLRRREFLSGRDKDWVMAATLSWGAVLMFVLMVLGVVLTFSVKIKRRSVLLLHPWGLMVLYLDVVVWVSLALYFHLDVLRGGPGRGAGTRENQYPLVCLVLIYVDSMVFCLLHYVYATYFIAAELSVIERCY